MVVIKNNHIPDTSVVENGSVQKVKVEATSRHIWVKKPLLCDSNKLTTEIEHLIRRPFYMPEDSSWTVRGLATLRRFYIISTKEAS